MIKKFIFIAAVLPLLVACNSDDADDVLPPAAPLTMSESEITIGQLGRYYTVTFSNVASGDSVVAATPMADWIEVDELLSSSLRIYVHPNDDERRREATVLITTLQGNKATLTVTQRSDADSDENALPGEALTVQGRVGFGYDLTQDYMDVKSATDVIFDYNALVLAEAEYGTIIGQDCRNRLDYTLHTAYSIVEMAGNLMSEQTDGVKFLGLSKKVTKYKSVQSFQNDKHSYGFAKISKTAATRYLDMGKIEALLREGRTDIFTADFRQLYDAVRQNPCQATAQQLVSRYGTHVVTYADLGGRLEYTINFSAHQVSREEMEQTMKFKNGNMRDSDTKRRNEKLNNINSTMDVTVYGGSEETRMALQKASPTTDTNQQIPTALLAAWTNTIIDDAEHQANLSMANCRLTPIWQLFPDLNTRNVVLSYVVHYAESMMLSPEMREKLGVSGYKAVSVQTPNFTDFLMQDEEPLVKVGYVDKIPMFEICNEYVPDIRGDRRVTIIYPIVNQRSNIRRGIFPGNGENPPCEVSFDEYGGCFIAQIEGYGTTDRIDSLYFIDGALYADPMNVPCDDVSGKIKIEPQYITVTVKSTYKKDNGRYQNYYYTKPAVKIGPGYWGRSCFIERENFSFNRFPPVPIPGQDNQWSYDRKNDDAVSGDRWGLATTDEEKWYYPEENNWTTLMNYLGNNMKPLFQTQLSGFKPFFDGYIVCYYDWNGFNYSKKYNENDCAMLLVNNRSRLENSNFILLLHPDYTFSQIEAEYSSLNPFRSKTHLTFAPVYPYHGSNYKYPYK